MSTKVSPVPTQDTTARIPCACHECKERIDVGERITKIAPSDIARIAVNGNLPDEIEHLIIHIHGNKTSKTYHADCAAVNESKTRSGRVVRAPVRLGNEKFIGGSGFVGCDTYDRGYDRGIHYDVHTKASLAAMHRLAGFVVSDDEPVEPIEMVESEEDAWESGDDTEEDEDEEMYESDDE